MDILDEKFVGRGENRVKKVLERLYWFCKIESQVPIQKLILPEDWAELGEIYRKHKFDFAILIGDVYIAAIEVNYKHGNTASRKWIKVFEPMLKNLQIDAVAINDYECKTLFNTKEERPIVWDDFTDVITALKMAGMKP